MFNYKYIFIRPIRVVAISLGIKTNFLFFYHDASFFIYHQNKYIQARNESAAKKVVSVGNEFGNDGKEKKKKNKE